MDRISILDDALINKIAAGEVIERPASVIKELVENSIDAGAKKINIEIKEGGKSFIKISDDGHGMSRNDAGLSWQRHATSKIRDAGDLFSVATLGFRGEALASIASVSELTLMTREEDSIKGTKIAVKAGKEAITEEAGCPKGTIIEVKDLFFNTPARKKYLKSIEVELGHITDIITRYALIHPEIHFTLSHNGRETINWPQANMLTNLINIYGSKVAKDLLKVNYKDDYSHITGFVSKPSLSRSTKDDQSFYVNMRYIRRNKVITDALNNAYHTRMMTGRYPVAILNIEINLEKTDVNVHPQKSEIRIAEEKQLYESVYNAVESVLKSSDLVPETLTDLRLSDYEPVRKQIEKIKETPYGYKVENITQELLEEAQAELPDMRVLGIVNKTYILVETEGNLIIIDQHAAAERILYERFTEQLKSKKVHVQKLLSPEIVEMTPKQFSSALANKEHLEELGYKTEEFGKNTVLVSTIPVVLGRQFNKDMFLDFVNEIEKPESLEKFFHEKIARMACRTAIKAGDEITLPQIKKYVLDLKGIPSTCPHGRPIMIKFSFYELEKMFKRKV
jgi:DNA mismatch repair protein MutL